MRITESKLKSLLEMMLDELLFPKGGEIGGEHQPKLKDKEFDEYMKDKSSGYTQQSKDIFNEKWYQRFFGQFGGKPKEVESFIQQLRKYVFRFYNQELGRNEKGIISDLRSELRDESNPIIKTLIKNYSIVPKTDEGMLDFIENIFPKIVEDYNFQIRRKKENV